ncbi:hypothetical protein EDI_035090 [Entamoeba dispar SAW760]|uniref:Uncharacterized protein n=1 Tax=Entamoeba dispar (strain ATCC PRA-260 / SAW760) TaxID=370354 RepID=B0EN26_ENTDS|nr:uncharacterized protein EDI_035090 [Entamoeba dispar SAW760]EDR24051.1 hypothetical protein EDI_035090 [Entamoeba dispar SAW760]|eukprot:EDR24051.1 hypothetical protein EDI_035090 [Entamoeba dispar SAW760]
MATSSEFSDSFCDKKPEREPEQTDEKPIDISVIPDAHSEESPKSVDEIQAKISEVQKIINEKLKKLQALCRPPEDQKLCHPPEDISQSDTSQIKKEYLQNVKLLNEFFIKYNKKTNGMTDGTEKRKDVIVVADPNERFVDIFHGKPVKLFLDTLSSYKIIFPRIQYCKILNSSTNTYKQLFGQKDFGVFCVTKYGNVFGIFFHSVKILRNQTFVCNKSALFIIRRNGMKEYEPIVSKRESDIYFVLGNDNTEDDLLITITNNIGYGIQFYNNTVSIIGDIQNVFNEIEYNGMLLNINDNNEYLEELNELKIMKIHSDDDGKQSLIE